MQKNKNKLLSIMLSVGVLLTSTLSMPFQVHAVTNTGFEDNFEAETVGSAPSKWTSGTAAHGITATVAEENGNKFFRIETEQLSWWPCSTPDISTPLVLNSDKPVEIEFAFRVQLPETATRWGDGYHPHFRFNIVSNLDSAEVNKAATLDERMISEAILRIDPNNKTFHVKTGAGTLTNSGLSFTVDANRRSDWHTFRTIIFPAAEGNTKVANYLDGELIEISSTNLFDQIGYGSITVANVGVVWPGTDDAGNKGIDLDNVSINYLEAPAATVAIDGNQSAPVDTTKIDVCFNTEVDPATLSGIELNKVAQDGTRTPVAYTGNYDFVNKKYVLTLAPGAFEEDTNYEILLGNDVEATIPDTSYALYESFQGQNTFTFKTEVVYPQITDVKIIGDVAVNAVLIADYDYSHKTGLSDASLFQWYMSDSEAGPFDPITINGTSSTYTVPQEYENKFIMYKVKPKAQGGAEAPDWIESNVVQRRRPPYAEEVKITSTGYSIGDTLTGSYLFKDPNAGDSDLGSTFRWLRYDTESCTGVPTTLSTSLTYQMTIDDIDKYIVFEVIPVSSNEPNNYEPYPSALFRGPARATANNVSIQKVSFNRLSGSYVYNHVYSVPEGNSAFEWRDGNGRVIGFEPTIEINPNVSGTYTFTVTPVAESAPFDGVPASATINIKAQNQLVFAGTGGGRGGGGNIAVAPKYPIVSEVPKSEKPEKTDVEFSDIQNHWAEAIINSLIAKDVYTNINDGKYEPDRSITRGELVSYLVRAMKLDLVEYADEYSDVKADDWYADYIQTACENGIISPYEVFRPCDSITREEVAKVIVEALGKNITEGVTSEEYSDKNEISEWAQEYVKTVKGLGIMMGTGNNTFEPAKNMTRAEAAAVLSRIISLAEEE